MNIEHLKGYIKRKLGHPVVNIEIDDTQLSDAITDAFEKFLEFHCSGTDIGYIFLDLIAGQQEYILDPSVYEVLGILKSNYNLNGSDEGMLLNPFYLGNPVIDFGGSNLIDVEIFRQNYQNFSNTFGKESMWEFNPVTKILTIHEIPENAIKIALKIYKGHIDPSTIYHDMWFKSFAVALAGIQWGNNLSKYIGGKLPGNVEINGMEIYTRYNQMRLELEEELFDRFHEPIDPFVG